MDARKRAYGSMRATKTASPLSRGPADVEWRSHQPPPRHDGRLDRLHGHRVLDRAGNAAFAEGGERLHVAPGILVARPVAHVAPEPQLVAREGPRPHHVAVLR